MRQLTIFLIVLIISAAGVIGSSSIAAEPEPMPWPRAPDPELVEGAARDLGMTPEQVIAADKKSMQATLSFGKIRELLGDAWAGGYLQRREDNALEIVVATTDDRMELLIKEMGADRVVAVRYSLKELRDVQVRLRPFYKAFGPKGLATVGVDLKLNRVTLQIKRGAEAIAGEIAATANVPIEMLHVEAVEKQPQTSSAIYGGEAWASITRAAENTTASHRHLRKHLRPRPEPLPHLTTPSTA